MTLESRVPNVLPFFAALSDDLRPSTNASSHLVNSLFFFITFKRPLYGFEAKERRLKLSSKLR